jgi:hypothetical protein
MVFNRSSHKTYRNFLYPKSLFGALSIKSIIFSICLLEEITSLRVILEEITSLRVILEEITSLRVILEEITSLRVIMLETFFSSQELIIGLVQSPF